MFFLKLLIAIVQAPVRRIAELLGLDAGPAREQPAERDRPRPRERPVEQPVPSPLRARAPRRRPARREPSPPRSSPRIKEVDEEPVLTAEFAEEGAEDGAGAEVHVDEPWEGYARMPVNEVKDRLERATPAELAAVELYEAAHRGRKSVLAAVEARARH